MSPHGFGHAARSAAVMEAMGKLLPSVIFDIFTKVPPWFFNDSMTVSYNYHGLVTDIGMVQDTALDTSLSRTVFALNDFLPFSSDLVERLALQLKESHCDLVVCDIAPLGIAAAEAAGLPAVLVENFTWDWIYGQYMVENDDLIRHIRYLKRMFKAARFHIQTEPVCQYDGNADLLTQPVSRKKRAARKLVRQRLGVPPGKKAVLITMGGIGEKYSFADRVSDLKHVVFVVPDGSKMETRVHNLILLPRHSRYYHPDMVAACDAVIGKLGYSTVAEVYHGRTPFGYVLRPDFPESQKLADFVEKCMVGIPIDKTTWQEGRWPDIVDQLLECSRPAGTAHRNINGAEEVGQFIARLLQVE